MTQLLTATRNSVLVSAFCVVIGLFATPITASESDDDYTD
jgi:hypothetical protein